jgi:hypothetical protein
MKMEQTEHLPMKIEQTEYLPIKIEQTECSKTSAYKIQTLGNYAEESIQHSEHSENFKSRTYKFFDLLLVSLL